MGFSSVVLIAQGLDRAVWFNTTRDGQNWSGWKSIGGQTDFGLCAINGMPDREISSGVMVWATGTNPPGHIFKNSSDDGEGYFGWSEVGGGGVAIAAPAIRFANILVPGTDQQIYLKYLGNPNPNSPFTKLPGDLLTTQGLCIVLYGGSGNQFDSERPNQFYEVAFAVSTDQKIYQNLFFTRNSSLPTGQWTEVPGGGVTNVAVAATKLPGTNATCLFAVGTDNKIYVNELSPSAFGDVSSWNGWGKLDDVGVTDVALAAATVPPLVYLFRKGLGDDKRIYFNVGEFPPR
jgi:hypothetical protein